MGRLVLLALAVFFWSDQARLEAAEDVDLSLVIAVDISTSMDVGEQQLQRQGYVAAFRHADVIRAITGGPRGRVAVTYEEWAGRSVQAQIVPWTVIADREDAEAFAAALEAAPIGRAPGTSISGGLWYAGSLFRPRDYRAGRLAIDVSGDGPNNTGLPVEPARDRLISRGVTINGLPIMLRAGIDKASIPNLDDYYEDCVIGGPGAFMMPVTGASEFGTAIRKKLVLEISGLPARPMLAVAVLRKHRVDCLIGEKMQPE